MNLQTISAVVFYVILAVLVFLNRKKMELISGIVLGFRTKKGIGLMKKLSKLKLLFILIAIIGIPIGFYFMGVLIQTLVQGAVNIITTPDAPATVTPIIPGVKIPGSPIYIPLWYGWISIIVISVIHEFSHGIVALIEKIKLKAVGFGMLLFFIPVAFVEMSEKALKKASRFSRIKVAVAGPMMNVVFAFLFLLLLSQVFIPVIEDITYYDGIEVSPIQGYPAEDAGIPENTLLTGINGTNLTTYTEFNNLIDGYSPGDEILLNTNNGDFTLNLTNSPVNNSEPYIGVNTDQHWSFEQSALSRFPRFLLDAFIWVYGLFKWIAQLSLLIGIINFLPLWIADGGQIVTNFTFLFLGDKPWVRKILNTLFYFVLILLLFNLVGPYLF